MAKSLTLKGGKTNRLPLSPSEDVPNCEHPDGRVPRASAFVGGNPQGIVGFPRETMAGREPGTYPCGVLGSVRR